MNSCLPSAVRMRKEVKIYQGINGIAEITNISVYGEEVTKKYSDGVREAGDGFSDDADTAIPCTLKIFLQNADNHFHHKVMIGGMRI